MSTAGIGGAGFFRSAYSSDEMDYAENRFEVQELARRAREGKRVICPIPNPQVGQTRLEDRSLWKWQDQRRKVGYQ